MVQSRIHSDDLMRGVYETLHADFFQQIAQAPLYDIREIRAADYRPPKYASPYNVKCRAQLAGWLKRYRFEKDLYSDEELEELTNVKFLDDMSRVGAFKPITHRSFLVLQKARSIIKGVLGPYREEDFYHLCSFSRRSTVGFRGKHTGLDQKIRPGSHVTGTEAECKWFTSYLRGDASLRRALYKETRLSRSLIRRRITYDIVDSLKQVNVPKTAKIHRPVCPNTLIGSFRSIGIGELVKQRIAEVLKIDLNHLQEEHRNLAKVASRTLHLVTADLSGGSGNFASWHINRLLPRDWYNALKLGRTPYVEVGGARCWLPAFMPMGIGYTFPVMTLCFMAILRAIQELSGTSGKVSVFGDDLIYPSKIHHFVVGVFNDLQFQINLDKTFTVEPFRESCGGDYYDKVDVRPARPEGLPELLEGNAIAAYVYKLYNSLIRRWSECEIPRTIHFLLSILEGAGFFGLNLFHVPDSFPDESGLKDGRWREFAKVEYDSNVVSWHKRLWQTKPSCNSSSQKKSDLRKPFYNGLLIQCLGTSGCLRPAGHQAIYAWEKVRGEGVESNPFTDIDAIEVLIWRESTRRDQHTGKPVRVVARNGRSYRKLVAFLTKRGKRYCQPTWINVS